MKTVVAKTSRYQGTFKASVTIVDTVTKKPVVCVTGHGKSLDVLDRMRSMCLKSASERFACEDPVLYFVRYGRRECDDATIEWTFLENNVDES
jgi:hypothetical protein